MLSVSGRVSMASKTGEPDLRKRMLLAGSVKSPLISSRIASTKTLRSRRLMVRGIWIKRIARSMMGL
jgi:hypothetical protein